MFLKRNARAHTYTKCLHHWLTAALALFFYSFFCVCTAHINAIISLFSCFFILSTSLPLSLTCFMCVCVSYFRFFCPSFLVLIIYTDGDTRTERQNLTKRRKNVCDYIIIRSNRQRAFEILMSFFLHFSYSRLKYR
jgi:hypothetical protein